MRIVRRVFFWLHLFAGVMAGLVIFTMAVTGILISFERQILDLANSGLRASPSAGTSRLPVDVLLTKARESQPGVEPTGFSWKSDPALPVAVNFGRERTVFFNPYTGASLGEGAKGADEFFHTVTEVHRWLALSGEFREIGKQITGVAALFFLFLVLSGIYLWWPRHWRWKAVQAVILFRGGLSGRTRDWQWHNVFGFWAFFPLLITLSTGLIIAYPWANNLLFYLTGNQPPAPRTAERGPGGPGGTGGPGRPRPGGEGQKGEGQKEGGREGGGRSRDGGQVRPDGFQSVARMAVLAEAQLPDWQTITARLPATFVIEQSHRGRPDKKTTVVFNPKSAEIVSTERLTSLNMGRQLRLWARWAHTGEAAGFVGQALAALTALAATMLVWTGFALSIRRFATWRQRRSGVSIAKTATDNRPQVDG